MGFLCEQIERYTLCLVTLTLSHLRQDLKTSKAQILSASPHIRCERSHFRKHSGATKKKCEPAYTLYLVPYFRTRRDLHRDPVPKRVQNETPSGSQSASKWSHVGPHGVPGAPKVPPDSEKSALGNVLEHTLDPMWPKCLPEDHVGVFFSHLGCLLVEF